MLEEGDGIREYTLKQFLGQGSYGEVWLAEKRIELADEGIPFALKFLTDQSGKGINADSLRNEVRTWIKAGQHFNIVSVHDGFIYGRFLVIVSEYIDGGSLRDWLDSHNNRAPSLETAMEMVRGILNGLAHLHSRKIIHRDLKPENILLKDGIPKITDFGVSRVVETFSQSAALRFTRGAGSPLYMPPEAFNEVTPCPQLDVWSVGVMFYEMLSGEFPFNANGLYALFNEIASREPKPLPTHIPKEVRDVVLTSLMKDVSFRFHTAAVMGQALESSWTAIQQRRQRPIVQREPVRQERKVESPQIETIAGDFLKLAIKCFTKGNYDDAVENYNKAIALKPELAHEKHVFASGSREPGAVRDYSRLIILNPNDAAAYYNRGNAYYSNQQFDEAIKDYNRAIELNPEDANAYCGRGTAYYDKRDYDRAIADYCIAIGLNSYLASAYLGRGNVYYNTRHYDWAINDYNRAIELNPRDATAYLYRGQAYYSNGKYGLAVVSYSKAIELNPQDAIAYYNRSWAYRKLGQDALAEIDYQKYVSLTGNG
jgi:serine/threonine protein kinase